MITLRFYEELNDFLPIPIRKRNQLLEVKGQPTIKDVIESRGVPHTEVDLILCNGEAVDFNYQVQPGDFFSIYPVFESFDITPVARLRPRPLRNPRFILDVHLGKLARHLRLLGFDSLYRNDFEDSELAKRRRLEGRILLTRDIGLLKRSIVSRGYWLRSLDPAEQLQEVVQRFQLRRLIAPFRFCLRCNGAIIPVEKKTVADELAPGTRATYDTFYRCRDCRRIYWQGSHFPRLLKIVKSVGKDVINIP